MINQPWGARDLKCRVDTLSIGHFLIVQEGTANFQLLLSALVFINAGYLAETFRGGFQSIPKTQYSASKSLGMNQIQVYRYIILPQMFRKIYHPMTNQFVWAILMSSLGILVGMSELSGETQRLQSLSFRTLEFFMVAAVMYYIITKFVLLSSDLIAKKLFKGDM